MVNNYKPQFSKSAQRSAKKPCFLCTNDTDVMDLQNAAVLKNFLTYQFKIASRNRTGACSKHQRQIAKAIKRARIAALLPFTQHQR